MKCYRSFSFKDYSETGDQGVQISSYIILGVCSLAIIRRSVRGEIPFSLSGHLGEGSGSEMTKWSRRRCMQACLGGGGREVAFG